MKMSSGNESWKKLPTVSAANLPQKLVPQKSVLTQSMPGTINPSSFMKKVSLPPPTSTAPTRFSPLESISSGSTKTSFEPLAQKSTTPTRFSPLESISSGSTKTSFEPLAQKSTTPTKQVSFTVAAIPKFVPKTQKIAKMPESRVEELTPESRVEELTPESEEVEHAPKYQVTGQTTKLTFSPKTTVPSQNVNVPTVPSQNVNVPTVPSQKPVVLGFKQNPVDIFIQANLTLDMLSNERLGFYDFSLNPYPLYIEGEQYLYLPTYLFFANENGSTFTGVQMIDGNDYRSIESALASATERQRSYPMSSFNNVIKNITAKTLIGATAVAVLNFQDLLNNGKAVLVK
jgi:hypothetical protein